MNIVSVTLTNEPQYVPFCIYLQHAPLHLVILHACRKLYDIYAVFTFLRIYLHTVYVQIVRLRFSIVDGVCKIGKLF